MIRFPWLAFILCFLASCGSTSDAPLPMIYPGDPTGDWSRTTSISVHCRSERDQQDVAVDGEATDRRGEKCKIPRNHGSVGGARDPRPVRNRYRPGDRRRWRGVRCCVNFWMVTLLPLKASEVKFYLVDKSTGTIGEPVGSRMRPSCSVLRSNGNTSNATSRRARAGSPRWISAMTASPN